MDNYSNKQKTKIFNEITVLKAIFKCFQLPNRMNAINSKK